MKMKIGDKFLETNDFTIINGKVVPVIKATSEEIKRPDGKMDVVIHIPCLKISSNVNSVSKEK